MQLSGHPPHAAFPLLPLIPGNNQIRRREQAEEHVQSPLGDTFPQRVLQPGNIRECLPVQTGGRVFHKFVKLQT